MKYWHNNQVAVMLHVDQHHSAGTQEISKFLGLDDLRQFLSVHGFNLKPAGPGDMPRASYRSASDISQDYTSDDVNAPYGKFLFPEPDAQGSFVISYFHVEPINSPLSTQELALPESPDYTRQVVSLINRNLDKLRLFAPSRIIAAMPNWLNGATPDGTGDSGTHGCPIIPPIPVPDGEASCLSHPGAWPITLLMLSSEMRSGEDVTVFVLDTVPKAEQIKVTATRVGDKNLLLKNFAAQIDSTIFINAQSLPERLDDPDPHVQVPATGKDVYGRLNGFEMSDHGLFVAGIIHELAPGAKIECIRVLNDWGVGNVAVLCDTLQGIQQRMEMFDLRNRPVVINLSLVTTPDDEELTRLWFGDNAHSTVEPGVIQREITLMRMPLQRVIQSLITSGAVIVASAGNDSDPRDTTMNMTGTRMGPRYPAAFPEVISVGAIDSHGNAAAYSNYPAFQGKYNGIATYGGNIPKPIPSRPDPSVVTRAIITDAVRGLYSANTFPALSAEDQQLGRPNPPVRNTNGWAYWSGTSFATPIISAVAALVLQKLKTDGVPPHLWPAEVQRAITTAEGQAQILTGGNPLPVQPELGVSMLKVTQGC